MRHRSLLRLVSAHPAERLALQDDSRCLSYGELVRLVREEMRWLAVSGGRRFGLLAENGCAWAIADLALHESGLLSVPLPASFTPAQLEHVARDAGIDALLTDQPRLASRLWPDLELRGVSDRTGLTLLRKPALDSAQAPPIPPGTAKVTYTSGSTSAPKGVCLSVEALETVALSLATVTAPLAIRHHLCLMPLSTLLENVAGIYATLLSGASCTTLPIASVGMGYAGLDPARLIGTISALQPQSLVLVPELLRLLLAAAEGGWHPPSSLCFVAVGGAAVSDELLLRAASLKLPVYQGYGLSECASVVCLNTPAANRIGSVGRPLPHAQVRCRENGEILVRGALMSGYLGDTGPAQQELATGDLGEIDDDGYVHVRGRLRNLLITSLGRNISPEWIERELAHETYIRHALAFGEARPYVVALIAKTRPEVNHDAIARAVARANTRLPDYARVRRWALLPETPSLANGLLTANGRLRREQVLNRFGSLLTALYEGDTSSGSASAA